jgi:undecaprenyl-diphosphatase
MNNAIFFFFYDLAHQSQILDKVVVFFAVYFPYIVAVLAGLFLLFYRKSWREFFIVFFSAGLAVLVSLIFKFLIRAPRPFLALPGVHALFSETGYAFPSGHATFFSALAVALFFYNKKIGYAFMFFALIIGIARIIAGVHFPIDILGGFIVGALVAFFVKNV